MKYRQHSSRDRAFVEHLGKRTYLPGKFNSPESLSAYRALVQSLDTAKPVLMGELVVRYLDHAKDYYPGERGEYNNIRAAMAHLLRSHKITKIQDFGPKAMHSIALAVANQGNSRGYSNKVIGICRRMFRWAVSQELIDPSVSHSVCSVLPLRKGIGRECAPVGPAKWSEVRLVIRIAHPQLADMIRVQWLTGCRPGEICNMQAADIDMTGPIWIWKPSHHKNAWRERTLDMYLGPIAQKALAKWVSDPVQGFIFSPQRIHPRYAVAYTNVSYRNAIKKLTDKLGQNPWCPHQIRHSKGTRMRSTYGVEVSRVVLGLASLETAQIYAESARKQAKKIARRF
jgi:integrase